VKESIPVTVFGQSLILRSNSSEAEVRRVAAFVNQAIDKVVVPNRVADSLNIALLAFLNVAEAYLQLLDERQGDQQEIAARLDTLLHRIEEEVGPPVK
jgi:cell division protein ZapA (FtsZ GTPase activity inhibitor)